MTGRRNTRNLASFLLVTLLAWGLAAGLSRAFAAEITEDAGESPVSPEAAETTDEPPPTEAAESDTCRPTTAALLVRGVRMFERQEMRAGLEVLARVVTERPEWEPALTAHAAALVRSGRFAQAAHGFAAVIGEEAAHALGRGELAARDLDPGVDPELVFGLAIANHFLGAHRVADRLYRTYADLVGPTSERAARAYRRLSEMFSEVDVPWGDAEAERAKALAVDPSIDTRPTLPDFPDIQSIAETEPYTRVIALAQDRPAPEGPLESLPVLIDWTEPAFEDTGTAAEVAREAIEILVSEKGRPRELALPSELDVGSDPGAALAEAVMGWCFEPAVGESGAVAAWITFETNVPVVAAPDTLGASETEAAESLRNSTGPAPAGGTPGDSRPQRED